MRIQHPVALLLSLTLTSIPAAAPAKAQLPSFAPNLARTDGTDPASGIAFTRLYLAAQPLNPATPTPTTAMPSNLDLSQPVLTAQCTRRPNGKFVFELFVNFGGVTDTAFYPPWKPVSSQDLFPPRTTKITLTMEFLGYTRFKPARRQFEYVISPQDQLRFNPPSSSSANLEDITYYLQVLRALPTLRISGAGHTASFVTTPLLTQLHAEPLCRASGL
ncbi:MAG: hypothetical protein NVSMB3_08830 [Acidobacteriaceae bacterium]